MRASKCYALIEQDGHECLWLEDLSNAPQPPWSAEQYLSAARDFGHFNAFWKTEELSQWTWLAEPGSNDILFQSQTEQALNLIPSLRNEPMMRAFLPGEWSDQLVQLAAELRPLVKLATQTDIGICHGDCHPNNLYPMKDTAGQTHTVAIDWEQVGQDYLGLDVGHMLSAPIKWLYVTPEEVESLVEPVFDAYVEGLHMAGWHGDIDLVQTSYLTRISCEAFRALSVVTMIIESVNARKAAPTIGGLSPEELFARWADALPLFVRCKEQAQNLVHGR